MHVRRRNAYTVYLSMAAANSFFFALIFTVSIVYQVTTVGLSPLQLVLVGTTLEAAIFIFQIPTGVVADVFSRRFSVIVGTILIGLGFCVEGAIPRFEAVLLAQILWGIGVTFVSGAEEAWISDELGLERAGKAFIRASQMGSIGGLIGISFSVLMGNLALNLPILVGGAAFVVMGLILIVVMPENGFKPTPREDRSSWGQMVHTTRQGTRLLRARPILLTIIAIGLFYGLYSEAYDRLWTDHILTNFTFPLIGALAPVTWFGIMRAGAAILSLISTEFIQRRVDTTDSVAVTRVLLIMNTLVVISLAAFALAGNFWLALLTFWLFNTMRGAAGPFYTTWFNQHIESNVRATMHSLSGQVDAFGQIVGGPLLGGLASGLTAIIGLGGALRATLLAAALILTPTGALYVRTLRRRESFAEAPIAATDAEPAS